MKKITTLLFIAAFTFSYSQCNYKTLYQNGATVKQFNPIPIGGDNNKQVALSISNINGNNNLMLTVRFKERDEIDKKVKFSFSDNTSLTLSAERTGEDFIGGSPISHLIFKLDEKSEHKFKNNEISTVYLNGVNKITTKMNKNYISTSLKCFD
ncbi:MULTISPECIES: hypothetical protein [Chryseobacterium]|uniref:Uncharacterized protein n=1 Tax=Chryseobacterium taihuense TaxID=1141221 RepID=A0A4U8WE99_9FLAO|nr:MULTISPECIES: hypothetical protein [Chryseobacterium]QQV03445.1 hypothetical protein I6I61_03615 [Chryseobacterium sp. FDAARGOS 1104]VFB03235.1 Uncharacterised protein [Chryseobacterium taihuense]